MELTALLDECGGELTPELELKLGAVASQFESKAGAIIYVLNQLQADADSAKALATHYGDKSATTERARDRLRERLAWAMKSADMPKVKTPHGTLSLGKSETLELDGDAQIPERFIVPPKPADPKPDKVDIKAALKSGEVIQGARLIEKPFITVR
jgi:transcription elongation GreA/GreB family factor